MAELKTISSVLKEISASYPGRFQPGEENVKAWTIYLVDIDDELLVNAVRSFISSSMHAFPPSIPEIRKEATKLRRTIAGIPDTWEAWEDLLKAGNGIRYETGENADGTVWIEKHAYEFRHPLIESVARGLGWPDGFPVPGNEMGDRAAFRDAYNEALSKLTKEDMQTPAVKGYIQEKQAEVSGEIKQLTAKFETPKLKHPHTGERLE